MNFNNRVRNLTAVDLQRRRRTLLGLSWEFRRGLNAFQTRENDCCKGRICKHFENNVENDFKITI